MHQRIFDIHIHIYPESIAQRATNAITDFYSGFNVSAHGKGHLEDCISKLDEAGTDMFAAHSVAVRPHNVRSICEFILDAHKHYPDRLVPFAAIHPDMENLDDFAKWAKEAGFKGFKIHPDMQRFCLDGDDVMPMMHAIEAVDLPVLIHCGDSRYDYDGPRRVLSLRNKLPSLKIIAAHFGGWLQWNESVEILPGSGIMVDLSSSLYKWSPERAAEIIRRFGTSDVIYGTDYPMWTPKEELERFDRIPLSETERADILWNNAARLFDLK